MYGYIFASWVRRVIFAVIAAFITNLLLDVLFSLQYRNYSFFSNIDAYFASILLMGLFIEGAFQLNKFLNRSFPWHTIPIKRLVMQCFIQLMLAIVVFFAIRIGFSFFLQAPAVILLSDEVTIIFLTIVLVIILNVVDFGAILLNQWRFSLAEAEKYRKESAEFEFEMLRAQVNPHFLFNSLNTLSSLVYEDQDKASEFIRKLSDVYRHVLESRKNELIKIGEEIEFIKAYIYLLELRFGEKLQAAIQVDHEVYRKQIAPLTLQMLVENAVKHNIISSKRPLPLVIRNEREYLIIENKLQKKQDAGRSTGMGLQNIRSRYSALTERNIEVLEENGMFTVKIPMIKENESTDHRG
jgi:hypothetical protein